jgi:hypothetical protein
MEGAGVPEQEVTGSGADETFGEVENGNAGW